MANKRIKDLATTKYKGFMALDDADGTGKFPIENLIGSIAPVFYPNVDYTAGQSVMHEGKLYTFKEDHPAGAWNVSDVKVDVTSSKSTTETIDKAADLKNAIFGISQILSGGSSGHIALAFPICKGVTYRITPSVNVGACYALDDNDAGEIHRLEKVTDGIYATQFFDYTAGVNADYISIYFSAAGSVTIESIGVNDLIESNPETAQLGFSKTITAAGIGWVITKFKGKKDFDYTLYCDVPVGVSVVASIDNATDPSVDHRIETFTSSLLTGSTLTFKPSTSFDYLAIYFANAGTCTLKLKYGVEEIYDRVGVIEKDASFLNKNMRGGVEIPSGSISGSKYGFESISIKKGRTYSLGLIPSADITNSNYITMKLAQMSDDSTYVQVSAWMNADYPKLLEGNFYFFNFTATEDVDDLKIGSYFNSASVDSAMTIQYYLTDVTELVASSGDGENATNAGVYYKDRLKVEIENLKKDSDVVLAFVSDLHYAKTALQRVVDVAESLDLDAIINGGDTVNNLNTEGLAWMNDIAAASSVPLLSVLGNHDCWTSSSPWVWSTAEENYNLFMPQLISVAGVVVPSDASTAYKSYWYKDFGDLRIIGLDGIDFDMTNAHHFDAAQLSWLESVLDDARTNSKAVIVVNHYPFTKDTSSKKSGLWNSWNTYLDGYQLWDNMYTPDSALSAVKSFIDAGGTLVAWLAGHQHVDYNITNSIDPRQVMHGIASGAGNKHGSDGVGSLSIEDSRYDCFDIIGIDLSHGFIKFLRCGYDFDACMQKREAMTWDYVNKRVFGGV